MDGVILVFRVLKLQKNFTNNLLKIISLVIMQLFYNFTRMQSPFKIFFFNNTKLNFDVVHFVIPKTFDLFLKRFKMLSIIIYIKSILQNKTGVTEQT